MLDLISNICSIIGLLISIIGLIISCIVANNVIKIKKSQNINGDNIKQTSISDKSIQVGKNIYK